jgi:anti-sigma factor RsiW
MNRSDEELVRSYLLGELPEEDADRTEGRLLAEDELFELAEAVEADLLAAADRGELTPAERERVEQRLAASPEGKKRLALARSLNQAAGRPPQAAETAPPPSVVPFRPRRSPAASPAIRWAALAAGVLALSGLSWYALERPHGGESPPLNARERPSPAHPVAPRPSVPAPLPPPRPTRGEETQTAKREPAKVILQLALLTTRGGSAAIRRLNLPRGAEIVELQIGIEGMEEFKSFDIAVKDHAAQIVWEKSGIEPRTLDGVPSLVAELPADRLPSGRCEITVQGLTPGRAPEDLSSQQIEVTRNGST